MASKQFNVRAQLGRPILAEVFHRGLPRAPEGARASVFRGFALVELAIVIVVFSLLLGGGLALLNGQIDNQRINTTRQRMQVIQKALEDHIARTGRLPCPAVASLAPGTAGYGVEAVRVTGATPDCTGTTAAGDGFKGVVPWTTLGVPGAEVNDGWSHRYTYQVARLAVFDVDGTERGVVRAAFMRGNITVHSATPIGVGLFDATANAAGNQVNGCVASPSDPNACNHFAVAVLVSHGKNGLGAWQESGIQIQLPAAGSREEANTNSDAAFLDQQSFLSDNAQHYDDLLLALAPRDLLAQPVAAKELKSAQATWDEAVGDLKAAVLSLALANPTGTSPNYYQLPPSDTPGSSAVYNEINPNDPRDRWGSKFIYHQTLTNIGSSSIGLAYTLTSPGPDRLVGPPAANDADNITILVGAAELKAILAKTGF